MGVFLQRYFGMYLLRGISTLAAPVRPRTPTCASARTCALMCVPIRAPGTLRFVLGTLRYAVASPRRALCASVRLGFVPVSFRYAVVRLGCLPLLRFYTLLYLPLFASFGYITPLLRYCTYFGCAQGYAQGYASASYSACLSWRAYFIRRWRYLSFILLHSASYSFFLTHVHLKLSYINHIFSVY